VELRLPKPQEINFVSIMEDVTQGQPIRSYVVDGLIHGHWQELCKGESIGHKRIQEFARTAVEAVRLRITTAAAKPIIRKLAVFNIQTLPPDPNNPAIEQTATP
jgi:hypothetical protein